MRDATIVYTDGLSERFEGISLTENGAIINRIIDGNVIACGFIPKNSIKEIKNGNRKV